MSRLSNPNKPPSSDGGNSTTSHQSETTPPPKPPPPPRKPNSFPSRDDCWSDESTFTLIEAWGDKIVKLNTGSLRQNHWLEVSNAVNNRHGHVNKNRRTDVQCKNRIDTLKKKYKVEKSKTEFGGDYYVSTWKFFKPLDSLIGSVFKPSSKTPVPAPARRKRVSELPALPPPPSSVPVGRRSKRPYRRLSDVSFFRRNFSVMAKAVDGEEDDDDSDGSLWNGNGNGRRNVVRKAEALAAKDGVADPYVELAEAIGRFAEVYERVEEEKQRQMVELEKQRMQFTKDLELERMKVFMESQAKLGRLKRLKSDSTAGKERTNEKLNEIPQSEQSFSSNGQVILQRSFYKIRSL